MALSHFEHVPKVDKYNFILAPCCFTLPLTMIKLFFVDIIIFFVINFFFSKDKILQIHYMSFCIYVTIFH